MNKLVEPSEEEPFHTGLMRMIVYVCVLMNIRSRGHRCILRKIYIDGATTTLVEGCRPPEPRYARENASKSGTLKARPA